MLTDIAGPVDVIPNPLPIRSAKIHRPPLRDDILSRERLNGWLDHAVTARLVLIVAEAGFGKTTLLADWARNSSRLTAWYRLEADDRDWLTFIRHVVSSGREFDPAFAQETLEALLQVGPGGPTREELVASLVDELADFGSAAPQGFTLIFDDYHVVDGSDETDPIVRAILERTGPGFSVVISGRSTPKLPLGRLRARRAVARLDAAALCFDVAEADRLFRDAYHRPLDTDVVTDLIERTEGWAALLSLVHTNLEESKPQDPRDLIRQLSATPSDLYDYVAQEVVDTLSTRLRDFVVRVSLLDAVDVGPAALVYEGEPDDILGLIKEAEELGLLTRPDKMSPHRFHPLVRTFLQGQLRSQVGNDGIRALHHELGAGLEGIDWRSAASHYRAAQDPLSAARVIDASHEEILASGTFEDVREFLEDSSGPHDRPVALILRSRLEFARGNLGESTELAQTAARTAIGGDYAGIASINLATILGVSGFADTAMRFAAEALTYALTSAQRQVAKATVSMWEAGHRGDLSAIAEELRELAAKQDEGGYPRYASITRLNLAAVLIWLGEPHESLAASKDAEASLRRSGSPDIERGAALAAQATALAVLRNLGDALRILGGAAESRSVLAREEAALETAKVLSDFGDLDQAKSALDRVGQTALDAGFGGLFQLVTGQLALRRADATAAAASCDRLLDSPCHDVAGELRGQLLRARVAVATRSNAASNEVSALRDLALAQRSRPGLALSAILGAIYSGADIDPPIVQLIKEDAWVLSILAEELARNLHRVAGESRRLISEEAIARPERWRSALRHAASGQCPARLDAAALLSEIGEAEDVILFRSLASNNRAFRVPAVKLARRLAPKIAVRDLGAVDILLGVKPPVRPLRRKVLGLLCFLGSRPKMAAARDEALDALWPDLGPETAGNSLHQTIYFLRRVFEPNYREGYGAGYVNFDGDIVSLDPNLIDFTSRRCWRLIEDRRQTGRDIVGDLLATYAGRYALDFAYEDWATGYRETLHAAVLGVLEAAIVAAMDQRGYNRAIEIAHAVLRFDPDADSVELALVRAYRACGSHSAAAEQYAHYSSVMRDQLGVEPPALEEL